MKARLVQGLGPVLATAALVAAARQPILAACLLAVAALSLAVGPAFPLGLNAQLLTLALAGVLGGALAGLLVPGAPPGGTLGGPWCIAASALALVALLRLTFTRPAGGARAGFALTAAILFAAGQVRGHGTFLALVLGALGAGLAAMRAADPARPRWRILAGRERATGAAVALGAVAFTLAMGWGLPRLHALVMARFLQTYGDNAESGLDDALQLDALASMLQSEEIVLRVYGRGVDRVRGAVYDRYDVQNRGRWRSTRGPAHTVVRVGTGPMTQPDAVMIERVGGARGWVMIPLATGALSTPEGAVRVDPLGAVRSTVGDPALRVWLRPGARTSLAPALPGPGDLAVPPAIAPRIAALAQRFSAGSTEPFARLEAIAEVLRTRYRYSLRFARDGRVDPVIDFLERHREGHCEYFASALALLGRAVGVPTRVVGGYRVAERNPFGGYFVVREKNAHAWVEAWDPARGWVTLDATPDLELPQNRRHDSAWWSALADGAMVQAGRTKEWFEARTTEQRLGAAVLLLVAWLGWRTWRGRAPSAVARAASAQEGPPPCWGLLAAALAGRGLARAPDETLDRFAGRVSTADLLDPRLRAEAASVIRDYAAARYGGALDGEIVRRTNEVARALR